MKLIKSVAWLVFFGMIFVFYHYSRFFWHAGVPGWWSLSSPAADPGEIYSAWARAGLLPLVRRVMWLDFVFIPCYVMLIMIISGTRLRKEPSIVFNSLLRANYFFAVAAGLADATENGIVLFNAGHWQEGVIFYSWWASWLKFGLVVWAIGVWLASGLKRWMK